MNRLYRGLAGLCLGLLLGLSPSLSFARFGGHFGGFHSSHSFSSGFHSYHSYHSASHGFHLFGSSHSSSTTSHSALSSSLSQHAAQNRALAAMSHPAPAAAGAVVGSHGAAGYSHPYYPPSAPVVVHTGGGGFFSNFLAYELGREAGRNSVQSRAPSSYPQPVAGAPVPAAGAATPQPQASHGFAHFLGVLLIAVFIAGVLFSLYKLYTEHQRRKKASAPKYDL